jgi:N-acetylneuraminic acid mutarotase
MDDDQKEIKIPNIPVGITSFGGVVMNDKLYCYGGHNGDAHQYYSEGQNKTVFELNLKNPAKWIAHKTDQGLQGLALVGHQGKIYRIGGFEARNKKGDEKDMHSVAEFAVFDFKTKKWQQLKPMPAARSSFDAVVVGDSVYVVGGWSLAGDETTQWSKTALVYDFSASDPQWKELTAPPFVRRAISLGYQNGKLYAVGGMQQRGGPTTNVAVFDLKSQKWSAGPTLPGAEMMEGFGSSCFNIGGSLIVSTYGGNIFRLSDDGKEWQKINQLKSGRFFHRLLPYDNDHLLIVGGADMESGKAVEVVVLPVNKTKK